MPKNNKNKPQQQNRKNLRGAASASQPKTTTKKKTVARQAPHVGVSLAPAAIGTTVLSHAPSMTHGTNSVIISGRDYVDTVYETNNTNWFLGSVVPINPVYFSNTNLGNLCRSYRYYRFRKLVAHFVTRQPTTAAGEVLMFHHPNMSKQFPNSQISSFLPRVMSAASAMMGPVWLNHSLPLKTSNSWKEVDAFSNIDIDDNTDGELAVYVQSTLTDSLGYIMFDYILEFKEMYVNEAFDRMPLSYTSERITALDAANNVAGALMTVVLPVTLNTFANGTIVKCVFDATSTTFATGTTALNALRCTFRTTTSGEPVVDGLTLYGTVNGLTIEFYPTLEAAKDQSTSSFISYGLTVAFKTTWSFTHYVVQWGAATLT